MLYRITPSCLELTWEPPLTSVQESNVRALEILFTYHGASLLAHRLALLSSFPETTSPHQYSVLLPEAWYVPWGLAPARLLNQGRSLFPAALCKFKITFSVICANFFSCL